MIRILLIVTLSPLLAATAAAEPLVVGAGFGATPVADCKTDLTYLNQVTGWQTAWPGEWSRLKSTPRDAVKDEEALARWRGAPAALNADIAALRSGLAAHRAAPRAVAIRVLQQVADLRRSIQDDATSLDEQPDGGFAERWRLLELRTIAPAMARYEAFLRDDYIPYLSEKSAIAGLDDDGACFSNAALWWTSLSLPKSEIEEIGERHLAAARTALITMSPRQENVDQILKRLRRPTASVGADALIGISAGALDRATNATPDWFMHAPAHAISIVPMAEHMRDSFPAGFYQPADVDAPAAYVINPSRPAERRLLAEAITFHEAVPGHHLFFTYPRVEDRGAFNSGLVEGWAIYAEGLADEMGLYATTLDREGLYAKRLWAASRLIIEPRLHSGAWTRKEAIRYMRRTTALPKAEIEIEIDRYLAMPGQSLAYMLGADVILRARAKAEAALGEDFDIKAFHDAVLTGGTRPLSEVEADVDAMIAARVSRQ